MLKFEEIVPGIKLLKTPFCGSWSGVILIRADENVLIDSGASREIVDECIVPALKDEGLNVDDISLLLNTHSHGDHVGGHCRFKEISNAKIGALSSSFDKIRDPLKYNKLIRAPFPKYSPPPSASLRGVEPDFGIEDGALIGGRLRLICTPGHDSDCVCWFDEKTRTLISGDSLQANGTLLQGVGFYQDLEVYRNSIRRLQELAPENIIAGHDYLPCGEFALGKENARWYIDTCYYLTETYHALIRDFKSRGIVELPELAIELIRHMGGHMPAFIFLPMFTVNAHLRAGA